MPPRRQPAPQVESKTGLVVSLVIFVLTTIIGAAFAVMMYNKTEELTKQANEAKKNEGIMKAERDKERLRRIMANQMIGITNDDDTKDLETLKGDKASYDAELYKLNVLFAPLGVQWDPATAKPTVTMVDRLKDFQTQLANAQGAQKQTLADADKSKQEYQASLSSSDAAKKAAQDAQQKANNAENEAKKLDSAKLLGAADQLNKLSQEKEQVKKDMEQMEINYKKQIAGLNDSRDAMSKLIRKQQEQLDLKRDDILVTDQAKGKIDRIDNRSGTAYINLGSADFVRPQLTFSIAAPGALGKAGKKERKGALEVVKVIGDHSSQAKIIDTTNAIQDPILEGDLLYNPAWDAGRRSRVAIAGLIDLTGSGVDQTQDFIRTLERQGILVDVYLDLKDIQLKGPGMTEITDYLILGEIPQAGDPTAGLNAVGTREDKKNKMREIITQMQEDAKKKGVPIIQYRRFMQQIGFPMPRSFATPEFLPSTGLNKDLGIKAAEDKKPEAPMPMKDKEKDEK
ncbi:MAG TPA: hypothetical protein VGZ47_07670 [Gemmataceae bacterium]|jgi:hypothetical protein|nr:hypothetical protein [Gemmataceae bacterium]